MQQVNMIYKSERNHIDGESLSVSNNQILDGLKLREVALLNRTSGTIHEDGAVDYTTPTAEGAGEVAEIPSRINRLTTTDQINALADDLNADLLKTNYLRGNKTTMDRKDLMDILECMSYDQERGNNPLHHRQNTYSYL
eukprot:UN25501